MSTQPTMQQAMDDIKKQSTNEIMHHKNGGIGKPHKKGQYRPKVMLQAFNKAHLSVLNFN